MNRPLALAPANKPNYRIPGILLAPNGDLLVFAEKRNDGIGDVGNRDILSSAARTKGAPGAPSR